MTRVVTVKLTASHKITQGQFRTTMTTILPGEKVDAQHVNLKLGPGLLQITTSGPSRSAIIGTRAGKLNHSANKSKWWIENNSRRVRGVSLLITKSISKNWIVCSCFPGVSNWGYCPEARRRLSGGHRICAFGDA